MKKKIILSAPDPKISPSGCGENGVGVGGAGVYSKDFGRIHCTKN